MLSVTQLLCSVDPKLLRLTPQDDAIYKAFRGKFPDLKIDVINEAEIKSAEGKEVMVHRVFLPITLKQLILDP